MSTSDTIHESLIVPKKEITENNENIAVSTSDDTIDESSKVSSNEITENNENTAVSTSDDPDDDEFLVAGEISNKAHIIYGLTFVRAYNLYHGITSTSSENSEDDLVFVNAYNRYGKVISISDDEEE